MLKTKSFKHRYSHQKGNTMSDKITTSCPYCRKTVMAQITTQIGQAYIERYNNKLFLQKVAICPICKKKIYNSKLQAKNLEIAYDLRKK